MKGIVFEKRKTKEQKKTKRNYDAILFGHNRIGFNILKSLKKIKKSYLVVDFNPDTVADLTKNRVPNIYGDGFDSDFLEDLPLDKLKLAISTIPDFETNMLLVEKLKYANEKTIVIVRASRIKDALELYKQGADYVLTSHFLGGEYLSRMVATEKFDHKKYQKEKVKHIKSLKDIQKKLFGTERKDD